MSSLRTFTTLKKKEKSKKSVPYAHDPDLAYDRTRNNLIEGLKITKAVSEATSFLGPMKAVCELGILFLETTKVVDENTSSLRELHQRLSAHIDILDDDLGTLPFGTRGPAAIAEFQHAQQRYVAGLKIIRDRLNDMLLQRVSGGVRSILGKIADARIDPRIIASIKEEITQYSQIFAEATSRPMIDLQEEVWKLASLGPEQARPMGTQHKLCLPGTRMSILKEIRNWASGFDTEKPMFWLCDVGGTGKSTVAYTLCHEWDTNDHVIVARFFFSKNARSTSETDIVCTTLANDLGSKDNAIRKHVQSAFVKDKQLDARPLSYQFSKLVEASIRLTSKRVVLVIDAVDECGADMRRDLLNLIVEKLPTLPNVRIFLTSRPEPDIMALLQGKAIVRNMHYELQGSENPSNVDDIKLYVEKYFTGLLTRSERQQLIDKANGLFIWVATARLELDQADGPDARVRTLTSLISRGEGGDINHLYAGILRRLAQETSFNEVKRIIGTISILFEPVSIQALSKLTRMDLDDLEPMIKSMHSVLRTEHVVEFLHPTFHEYLHSGRNTELRIDADRCHLDVARGTLQTLQADLRQDVCNISTPYQRYPDNNTIIDLDTRLNALWAHSPALLYSAKYWSAHVIPVISHQDMLSALELFLHNSALHVIELLSLIGKLVWTKNFEDIRKSLQGNSSRQDEYSLCREVVWSMSTYQHLIKRSALSIYSSALFLLPRNSTLYAKYYPKFQNALPRVLHGRKEDIPLYLELVEQDTGINCCAFSPDGAHVISGAKNGSIRLWDSATGAAMGTPVSCGRFPIQIICFSWDGTMVASCSDHSAANLVWGGGWSGSIIHIWDILSGVQVALPIIAGDIQILDICFTKDSPRLLAVGYNQLNIYEVRLWSHTGAHLSSIVLGQVTGCAPRSRLVNITRDAKQIFFGLESGNIGIFDAGTGKRSEDILVSWQSKDEAIKGITSSTDGTMVAAIYHIGQTEVCVLRVWIVATKALLQDLYIWGCQYVLSTPMAFTDNNSKLMFTAGFKYPNGNLRVYDIFKAELVECTLQGELIEELHGSQNDPRVLGTLNSGKSLLWDPKLHDRGCLQLASTKGENITCFCISDSKHWVITGSKDAQVQVWDASDGRRVGPPLVAGGEITCVDISHDDSQILCGYYDGELITWDRITRAVTGKVRVGSHDTYLENLRYSLDGKSIWSCLSVVHFPTHYSYGVYRYYSGTWVEQSYLPSGERISSWEPVLRERPITEQNGSTLAWKEGYISDSRRPCIHFELPHGVEMNEWRSYDNKIALLCRGGRFIWLDFTNMATSP